MGVTIRTLFSDSFSEMVFGKVTGTFGMSRFPSVSGKLARIKTYSGNGGSIWLGTMRNTGMFPLPFQLAAGVDTEWFPLIPPDAGSTEGDLSMFYQNGSSGTSYIAYWVLK